MPYITKERRDAIVDRFAVNSAEIKTVGELNYAISYLADRYIKRNGLGYQTIAEVRAAMHDAAAEFYRIVAVPYENMKIALNGPVYGPFEGKK